MSLPEYPRQENDERDHHAAIKEMFYHLPTPARPQHANVNGTIMSFTGVSPAGETLYWRFAMDFSDGITREVRTIDVWDDWVHGSLMPVRVEFLAADESVYNKEEQAVVPIEKVN